MTNYTVTTRLGPRTGTADYETGIIDCPCYQCGVLDSAHDDDGCTEYVRPCSFCNGTREIAAGNLYDSYADDCPHCGGVGTEPTFAEYAAQWEELN